MRPTITSPYQLNGARAVPARSTSGYGYAWRRFGRAACFVAAAGRDGPRSDTVERWLPDMDLNHDKQIQSLLCYRYTIGQTNRNKVEVAPRESRMVHPYA
jgi:hypothetical protein